MFSPINHESCRSLLLLITVLEALSQESNTTCPWEKLYAEQLVINFESLEELQNKLIFWKSNMEEQAFRVNMVKTRVLISGLDELQKSGKETFTMCLSGVGTDSIFGIGCSNWVNNRCSDISGTLKPNHTYRCNRRPGLTRPVDGRPMPDVTMEREILEIMVYLRYLRDCLSSGGRCKLASSNDAVSHGANSTSSCP